MKDFYPLSSYPRTLQDWDIVQFIDPDSQEAVILAYRFEGEEKERRVKPKKLVSDLFYEVVDPFSGETLNTASGSQLIEEGLSLELEANSALVRHLKLKK